MKTEFGVQSKYGIEAVGKSEEFCRAAVDFYREAPNVHGEAALVRREVTDWELVESK